MRVLGYLEFALNNSVHKSTGKTSLDFYKYSFNQRKSWTKLRDNEITKGLRYLNNINIKSILKISNHATLFWQKKEISAQVSERRLCYGFSNF
jgi:hypothetical protein